MREKLSKLRDELDAIPRVLAKTKAELQLAIGITGKKLDDFIEYVTGWAAEMGQQLFGMHIVQEMLCEKTGISKEDVKARIDAREAALAEQQALLKEAADKAHAEAEAEKARQATEATASTTEQPETPAGGDDGEAAVAGPDQHDNA